MHSYEFIVVKSLFSLVGIILWSFFLVDFEPTPTSDGINSTFCRLFRWSRLGLFVDLDAFILKSSKCSLSHDGENKPLSDILVAFVLASPSSSERSTIQALSLGKAVLTLAYFWCTEPLYDANVLLGFPVDPQYMKRSVTWWILHNHWAVLLCEVMVHLSYQYSRSYRRALYWICLSGIIPIWHPLPLANYPSFCFISKGICFITVTFVNGQGIVVSVDRIENESSGQGRIFCSGVKTGQI